MMLMFWAKLLEIKQMGKTERARRFNVLKDLMISKNVEIGISTSEMIVNILFLPSAKRLTPSICSLNT